MANRHESQEDAAVDETYLQSRTGADRSIPEENACHFHAATTAIGDFSLCLLMLTVRLSRLSTLQFSLASYCCYWKMPKRKITEDSGAESKSTSLKLGNYAAYENGLKLCSWNAASLNASLKKGFWQYVHAENPDLLLIQEIKSCTDDHVAELEPQVQDIYPHRYYWHSTAQKGYAGTAVWSKIKPVSVQYGFPDDYETSDDEGRLITLEMQDFYLINAYVPNAGNGLKRMDFKLGWNESMRQLLWELEKKKPVIWAGDLNVALSERDLARPKSNWNKTAGYTEREINSFHHQITQADKKFVDAFRQFHPDEEAYTYYSYRFQCRQKNIGWRLDYFMVSSQLADRVESCDIRNEVYGPSDHVPSVLCLKSKQ